MLRSLLVQNTLLGACTFDDHYHQLHGYQDKPVTMAMANMRPKKKNTTTSTITHIIFQYE